MANLPDGSNYQVLVWTNENSKPTKRYKGASLQYADNLLTYLVNHNPTSFTRVEVRHVKPDKSYRIVSVWINDAAAVMAILRAFDKVNMAHIRYKLYHEHHYVEEMDRAFTEVDALTFAYGDVPYCSNPETNGGLYWHGLNCPCYFIGEEGK